MIDARPGTADLALYAGDAFTLEVTITSADGWDPSTGTWAAQIRTARGGQLAAQFTTGWASGVLTLSLTGVQTRAVFDLAAPMVSGSRYRWDLQVTLDGATTTIVRGAVSVSSDITTGA